MTSPQLSIEVSWFWDWVPAADADDAERTAWSGYVTQLLDTWVGEKVAAARAAWPADADEEFPFHPGEMGPKVAHDLIGRTDGLPANCRLIWGRASSTRRCAGCPYSSWPSSANRARGIRPI